MYTTIYYLGFGFIGLFEINGYSKINKILHYSGIVMVALGLPAFGIMTNFDVYYWLISCGGLFIGLIYSMYVKKYGGKYANEHYSASKVHEISVVSIMLELLFTVFNLNDL